MKYPIIAINRNVGTTTSYDPRQSLTHQFSFGIPHYFFRFNFTSAIKEKPYSYVNWIKFKATKFYRTSFMGHIVGERSKILSKVQLLMLTLILTFLLMSVSICILLLFIILDINKLKLLPNYD